MFLISFQVCHIQKKKNINILEAIRSSFVLQSFEWLPNYYYNIKNVQQADKTAGSL